MYLVLAEDASPRLLLAIRTPQGSLRVYEIACRALGPRDEQVLGTISAAVLAHSADGEW